MAKKAQQQNPNIPILGQPKPIQPVFQMVVYPIEPMSNSFEAMMGLTEKLLLYCMGEGADPAKIDDWRAKPENQLKVQFTLVYRAMGCLCAMAGKLDPSFDITRKKYYEKILAMVPLDRPETEEEKDERESFQDNLEKAKANFLEQHPEFDPHILERGDDPGVQLELMKKNIEQKGGGQMEFHQDHPHEGGGLVPPGPFKPRHSKVLNPHVEIVSPSMLEEKS